MTQKQFPGYNKEGTLDVSDDLIAQHFHDYYTKLPKQRKPPDTQGNRK